MWVPFAILTAFAFAASGSYAKALSRHVHVYVVTWSMMVLSLPWAAALLFREGLPPIQPRFLGAALASVALNMVAVTLEVRAVSVSPLSLTVPFLGFTPLFMIATGALVLGETPDLKGLLGIVLVALGAYTIYLDRIKGGILGPVKAIARERGSRLMLVVALVWSVSAVYDKVAVLASSPAFYQTFFAVAFGVFYAPFLLIGLRKTPVAPGIVPRLFLIGAICAVMTLSQFAAIQFTLASYVIAVKRSGMIVSVILGYFLFKEENLKARLAGALLMSSGVVLLSV